MNKVATAVQLRWDVGQTSSLPGEVKDRLKRLAGSKMTTTGELVINARRYRSQEQNREDAVARLVALVEEAAKRPMNRRNTSQTRVSKEKRLEDKRRRSETKRRRGRVTDDE